MRPIARSVRAFLVVPCLSLPFLGATATAPAEEGVAEKHKLHVVAKEGDALHFRMSQEQTMSMMGMETRTAMKQGLTWTAKSAGPRGVTWDVLYGHISGSMDNPLLGEIAFDSAKPPAEGDAAEDPMATMKAALVTALTSVVGGRLTVEMAPHGELKEIKGLGDLVARMVAASEGVDGMEEVLSAFSDESGLQQAYRTNFPGLPENPVAVGEEWKTAFSMTSSGLEMKFRLTHTLSAVTADTFLVSSKVTLDEEAIRAAMMKGAEEQMGGEVPPEAREAMDAIFKKIVFTGDGTIASKYRRNDGMPDTVKQTFTIHMQMPEEAGGFAMDMTVGSDFVRVSAEDAKGFHTPVEKPAKSEPAKEPGTPAAPAAPAETPKADEKK